MFGERADLHQVLDLAGGALRLHHRGIDLGEDHIDAGQVSFCHRLEAGLERPDPGRLAARVLQPPHDGNAHDRLAAHRAVVVGLPDRGRALGRKVRVAELRQVARSVRPALGGHQGRLDVLRRRPPKGERPVGQQPVELGGDVEAVVDVGGLVDDPLAEFVPGRAPGLALQLQGVGEPAREPQREIESHQSPFGPLLEVRQDQVQPRLGVGPRRLVEALERQAEAHVAFQHADPDGIRTGGRLGGRAPVDDHIGAEKARQGRAPGRGKTVGSSPSLVTGQWRYASLTSILPRFSPLKSPMKASGAFSIPSKTVSFQLTLPSATHCERSAM